MRPVNPADRQRGVARARSIPALDGIRAIAVGLVLADHGGLPGLSGGFLGVDVFFVLSGFLITSLLLDEFGRTGRISLRDFWIRRARRLLPALVVMVMAVAVGRHLFADESVGKLRDEAIAAFFWMANWAFVAQDTDYFTQGAAPSPLQHTWSLGVEEQYYLVWPLLVLAVAGVVWLVRKRPNPRAVRWGVFGLAVVGAAASAAEAILLTADGSLNRVYFGTDSRVQALLIGAAAAALLVRDWPGLTVAGTLIRRRWRRWVAWLLPVVGLVLLGVTVHNVTGTASEFHSGLLIVAALAAVLIIAPVALDQYGWVAKGLSWRPLVFLGGISYGVYLWHWPVFLAVNGELTGWHGMALFAARCAVTLLLAWVSSWLIEGPVRRWRPATVPMLPLAGAVATTAAAVTTLVVPVHAPRPAGPPPPEVSQASMMLPEVPVPVGPSAGMRSPGTRNVAVFGDSVGWTMMRYLPQTPGYHFSDYTIIGCGVARGGPYRTQGETINQKPECDSWPARWSQRLNHDKPDMVLLVIGRWEIVDRMNEGHWTHIGNPPYDTYLRGELQRALDTLGSTGAHVLVTNEPYNRRGERPDGSLYPEDDPDRVDEWNDMLKDAVQNRPNVTLLDLNKKLGPDGDYTGKIDGIKMRSDGVHPTAEAVKWMTPWLIDSLNKTAKVSAPAAPGPAAGAASPGPCPPGPVRCTAR